MTRNIKRLVVAVLLAAMPAAAMAQNVTSVTITNGVPTAPSGTVSTLDAFVAAAGSSSTKILGVQGVSGMTPFLSAQSGTWSVGLTGTLPAFAATPTFNLGTLNGAATAANQSTANTSLSSIATNTGTIATNSGLPIPDCGTTPCTNRIGTIYLQSQYPAGAVPLTASATGTTAATTATLAGTTGKTTFVCGFSIRANATAAATGNATVTGTITGTLNFTQWTAPLASGLGVTEPAIGSACIPASATNTGIAVISAAPGSGGVVSVTAWGYQL